MQTIITEPTYKQIQHNYNISDFKSVDSTNVTIKCPFKVRRMKVSCGYKIVTDTGFGFYNITMDTLGDIIASCGIPTYTDGTNYTISSDVDYSKGIWFEFAEYVQLDGSYKINLVPIDGINTTKNSANVILDFECYSY